MKLQESHVFMIVAFRVTWFNVSTQTFLVTNEIKRGIILNIDGLTMKLKVWKVQLKQCLRSCLVARQKASKHMRWVSAD